MVVENPFSKMTVSKLKAELDERGIEYTNSMKKAELIDLLA